MEFKDLLTTPDFERRCDNFVAEVTSKLVGDYPELEIHPLNKTRDDLININPKAIKLAEKRGGGFYLRKLDKIQDELSAFQSVGIVEVLGWEGPTAVTQIKEVVIKIDAIAKRHKGIKDTFDDGEKGLNDSTFPSAHLVYTFK